MATDRRIVRIAGLARRSEIPALARAIERILSDSLQNAYHILAYRDRRGEYISRQAIMLALKSTNAAGQYYVSTPHARSLLMPILQQATGPDPHASWVQQMLDCLGAERTEDIFCYMLDNYGEAQLYHDINWVRQCDECWHAGGLAHYFSVDFAARALSRLCETHPSHCDEIVYSILCGRFNEQEWLIDDAQYNQKVTAILNRLSDAELQLVFNDSFDVNDAEVFLSQLPKARLISYLQSIDAVRACAILGGIIAEYPSAELQAVSASLKAACPCVVNG